MCRGGPSFGNVGAIESEEADERKVCDSSAVSYRIRRSRAARSMYAPSSPSSFSGVAPKRLERGHARAPIYIRSLPMSALRAAIDRRLERLFRILEKGTLDGRRIRGDGN
jgi:hypothetical protein